MSEQSRKLFVAGLSGTVTEGSLRETFESAGAAVTELSVPRDRATGRPRGFAFVTLETAEQAERAMSALNGTILDGRPVTVRPFEGERGGAGPRSERQGRPERPRGPGPGSSDDSTLYVGNLPFDTEIESLTAFFGERGFPVVKRIHLPVDAEGRKRGFGFVTLDTPDSAKQAAEQLQGVSLNGRSLSLNLARRNGPPGGGPASGGPGRSAPRTEDGRGGDGVAPRPQRAPAPTNPRPGGGGGFAARPAMPAGRSMELPPPTTEEGRRDGARREKKKDKKRKGRGLTPPDRGPKRRRNEGFNSPRSRGGDWDDDD